MLLSMTLDGDASTWSNGASLPRDRSALHASEYERRDESLLITSSAASPSMQGARDVHTGERNRAPSAQWPDEGGISKQRYTPTVVYRGGGWWSRGERPKFFRPAVPVHINLHTHAARRCPFLKKNLNK